MASEDGKVTMKTLALASAIAAATGGSGYTVYDGISDRIQRLEAELFAHEHEDGHPSLTAEVAALSERVMLAETDLQEDLKGVQKKVDDLDDKVDALTTQSARSADAIERVAEELERRRDDDHDPR